jgi:hypothetical protein
LVPGNVVGSIIRNFVCIFVSENVGDEDVGLLVGCPVRDDIVANEIIGSIGSVRVRALGGVFVGN